MKNNIKVKTNLMNEEETKNLIESHQRKNIYLQTKLEKQNHFLMYIALNLKKYLIL